MKSNKSAVDNVFEMTNGRGVRIDEIGEATQGDGARFTKLSDIDQWQLKMKFKYPSDSIFSY